MFKIKRLLAGFAALGAMIPVVSSISPNIVSAATPAYSVTASCSSLSVNLSGYTFDARLSILFNGAPYIDKGEFVDHAYPDDPFNYTYSLTGVGNWQVLVDSTSGGGFFTDTTTSCTTNPVIHALQPLNSSPAYNGPDDEPMPSSNLTGWKLIYKENFNTNMPLGTVHATNPTFKMYPTNFYDSPRGIGQYNPETTTSVSGGILSEFIHTDPGAIHPQIAAVLPIVPGDVAGSRDRTYGRWSIRWRADALPGYMADFLLWPSTGHASDGETDVWEGGLADGGYCSWFHHSKGVQGYQDGHCQPADSTQWHTSTIEWSPGLLTSYTDGVQILRMTGLAVTDISMHMVMQTTVYYGADQPAQSVRGNVQIAWISAWSYNPGQAAMTVPSTAKAGVAFAVKLTTSSQASQVKWYVDGVERANDSTAPWSSNLTLTKGTHKVYAKIKALSLGLTTSSWYQTATNTITVS